MERRRFTRILFQAPVMLCRGERCWDMKLVDLSLQGALVRGPVSAELRNGLPLRFIMQLPQSDTHILMQSRVAYSTNELLGLECLSLDMESAGHLKSLVALNVGSTALLYRELAQLGELDDDELEESIEGLW
ncbi:PilZ domain-containing protein [Gallaecimonas sp. GXIMD4217]|uniref:PilZ domain-containing protein n=1 Tax=Gallaecimonas sp. GXIMD4217 TaxID=3131927 RepID=UPI00311AF703